MNYCNLHKLVTVLSAQKIINLRTASSKPVKTILTAEGKEVPRQKNYQNTQNRITLISPDNSVSITDLKNAQNLSIRRELKLVKVQDVDSKTRRPVYKLMTNSEYHAEELENRKEKQASKEKQTIKGEKLLTLSSRIGDHDLMTGVKKMMKLVEKQYEVRVIIAGEDEQAAQKSEAIYTVIENNLKSICKIVQKRMKGNNLRFQLLPLKENSNQAGGNLDNNQNDKDRGPI